LVTGAADDDPSGIGTYSQTGAQFGYAQLWTSVLCLPLMIAIQEICARIALQTGQSLAQNMRRYYSRWILYPCVGLLVVANIVNLGADLGAMAASAQMLLALPYLAWLLVITALIVLCRFSCHTTPMPDSSGSLRSRSSHTYWWPSGPNWTGI
jgi:Mn2+/Fe2+ NRAMP family transporter